MDVGIRELKARLSEFVEQAARGHVIRVTDRGHPKAILGPLPAPLALEQGRADGWVVSGTDEPPAVARRRFPPKMSVEEALAGDRGR